ncbi:MAG: T9SS type A sorting domain-containing protein, partial [Bacteroidales bacterium]|nr:T9SS type A sorting domain-containing protein [Bacteroidales bacterium]
YGSTTAIGDIDGDNDLDMIVTGIANQATTDIFKPRVYKNMLVTTSIEMANEEGSENILFYPNPSAGTINIETVNTSTSSIKIYNTIGELVFSNDDLTSNAQIHLDQPPGIYFVVVKTSNSTSTSKVILR